MTDTLTNIGTVVSVSAAAPATFDQAGYEALSFSEVTGVASIGEFGPSYEILNHVDLKDGITQKAHGALNYGDPALQYRIVEADTGQGILDTALSARTTISLKVERASGLVQYVQTLVTSAPTSEGTSGAIYMKSSNLALKSAIVEVAA